jgi:hypothetical protein
LENLKKGDDLVYLTVDIRIILKWTSKIVSLGDFRKNLKKGDDLVHPAVDSRKILKWT